MRPRGFPETPARLQADVAGQGKIQVLHARSAHHVAACVPGVLRRALGEWLEIEGGGIEVAARVRWDPETWEAHQIRPQSRQIRVAGVAHHVDRQAAARVKIPATAQPRRMGLRLRGRRYRKLATILCCTSLSATARSAARLNGFCGWLWLFWLWPRLNGAGPLSMFFPKVYPARNVSVWNRRLAFLGANRNSPSLPKTGPDLPQVLRHAIGQVHVADCVRELAAGRANISRLHRGG